MSPEFVEEGSWLAGLEMASGGVTTTSDHYFFPTRREGPSPRGSALRVSAFTIGFPSAWAKTDEEYPRARPGHSGDVQVGRHGPRDRGAPTRPTPCPTRRSRSCAELSEKYDAPIHMHGMRRRAKSPTRSATTACVRWSACSASARERPLHLGAQRAPERRRHRDARCRGRLDLPLPVLEPQARLGFSPIAKLLAAGVNVGIGTDGAASNDKLDMLGETRLAAMLAKAVAGDTTRRPSTMLYAATMGGAKALHWDAEIGSLEPGKAADVIAVDLSGVEALPVQDPAAQLLYAAGREAVTHTWVAGELIATQKQSRSFRRKHFCRIATIRRSQVAKYALNGPRLEARRPRAPVLLRQRAFTPPRIHSIVNPRGHSAPEGQGGTVPLISCAFHKVLVDLSALIHWRTTQNRPFPFFKRKTI